jgi:hypothetical protein
VIFLVIEPATHLILDVKSIHESLEMAIEHTKLRPLRLEIVHLSHKVHVHHEIYLEINRPEIREIHMIETDRFQEMHEQEMILLHETEDMILVCHQWMHAGDLCRNHIETWVLIVEECRWIAQ